jgi:hypothetical protein
MQANIGISSPDISRASLSVKFIGSQHAACTQIPVTQMDRLLQLIYVTKLLHESGMTISKLPLFRVRRGVGDAYLPTRRE